MYDHELKIERLHPKRHQRGRFQCGYPELEEYLSKRAGQDQKRKLAVTYVLAHKDSEQVVGYYTLSAYSVNISSCPDNLKRRLPRYPSIPGVLIGRLAVDTSYRGCGWGETILMSALSKSFKYSESIGALAVFVHAKDDKAKGFYRKYGFHELVDDPYHLFLPMKTIKKLVEP